MRCAFIILIIVGLLFSCSGSPNKSPVPTTSTSIQTNTSNQYGDIVWISTYARVELRDPFRYVGSHEKEDEQVRNKYYVYDAGKGIFLYIVEVDMKHGLLFPDDYDPVLAKDQNRDNKYLLEYSPRTYSIWSKLSQRSQQIIKEEMGIEVSECYNVVKQAKLSPKLDGGVWVIMVFPSSCIHDKVDDALNYYAYHVTFR